MGRNKTSQLVAFNSKVMPETKEIVDAIIKTNDEGLDSVRAFIEWAVVQYEKYDPESMRRAHQYLDIIGKGVKIYEDPNK